MNIVNINKHAAIDKIVEHKIKDISIFKNLLKYGWEGFYNYSIKDLELILKNIDSNVEWKIIN